MFDLVKQSYQAGWYTLDNVKTFVVANMITKADYKEIIGHDYDDGTAPASTAPTTSAVDSSATTSQAV